MPIMCARFVIILIGAVVFGRICIAGTWHDDFGDNTLEDWGKSLRLENDEFSAGVTNGRFNFIGKSEKANLVLRNLELGEIHDFTLEMKFMIGRIEKPEECSWALRYDTDNDKSLNLEFRYALDAIVIPGMSFVEAYRVVGGLPTLNEFEAPALARFGYEEEVWYRLKFEAHGRRFVFWIENFGLEKVDDSLPAGWIELQFVGRCDIWLDDFTVVGPTVPDGGPGSLRAVLASDKLTTTWGRLKVRD